ncbi:MAG: radical SAM protein, partial [Spirochaetales bacterium]|nr:radical SAM protein [Spirochaetales bacterium]
MAEIRTELRHPCFDADAAGTHCRVHLPVAPQCNVQCNFCSRKYDCVNESRPGVTSKILSPGQALHYVHALQQKRPISVIGIAGPGDVFADPVPTLTTLRLIREHYESTLFCLSTNGLSLLSYVSELAELGVGYVTITVNAIDPEIGAKIYSWIRVNKRVFSGVEAASLLLENQLGALASLKAHGITVKINTIVLPGINDHHVADIAMEVARRGADVHNCIPLIPVPGSVFEHLPEPEHAEIAAIRKKAGQYLPQMKHCQRCRADAAGLIAEKDPTLWQQDLADAAALPFDPTRHRPYVAVASREGFLVSQHLGEASSLLVYGTDIMGNPQLLEKRPTPPAGSGDERWHQLSELFADCRSILVNGVGNTPYGILQKN